VWWWRASTAAGRMQDDCISTRMRSSVWLHVGLLLLQLDKDGANVLLSQGRLSHRVDSEWWT
jgi:hypothetical protein